MIKNITLKLNTSFFQFAFTVLAVLCTLQMHGFIELNLHLDRWPLIWLTWQGGILELIKTAFCAWIILPLICNLILALIVIVPFLIIWIIAV
jgi:hypothetical protein